MAHYLPLVAGRIWPQVDRAYRAGGTFQWVRETLINAGEAGASRVHFGVEWQAASAGVFRRLIADNGSGMDADELPKFFRHYGGGGKPIGDLHDNFGVGAKSSLLPWNTFGLVVCSWKNGEGSMILIRRYGDDPQNYEFGLHLFETTDDYGNPAYDEVVEPYYIPAHELDGIDLNCDFSQIRPDWMKDDDGTVLVLLGDSPDQHTILGDPSRVEFKTTGFHKYLNSRFWEFPPGLEVTYEGHFEGVSQATHANEVDTSTWQQSGVTFKGGIRAMAPAALRPYLLDKAAEKKIRLESDTMRLSDGTKVHWLLLPPNPWEMRLPNGRANPNHFGSKGYGYANNTGMVAALYKSELYDVPAHTAEEKARAGYFNLHDSTVRDRVFIIVEPPLYDPKTGVDGVAAETSRFHLWHSGTADGKLPWWDWGLEFYKNLPDPILRAIKEAASDRKPVVLDDASWRKKLEEKFASRWRKGALILTGARKKKGDTGVDPTADGDNDVAKPGRRGAKTGTGTNPTGRRTGTRPARRRSNKTGSGNEGARPGNVPNLPMPKPDFSTNADDFDPGMMAKWIRPVKGDADLETGKVLIYENHPVLVSEIQEQQARYHETLHADIRETVLYCYGLIAVAAATHVQLIKGKFERSALADGEKEDSSQPGGMLSQSALTMSMMGLLAQSAYVDTVVGGKFRKKLPVAGK